MRTTLLSLLLTLVIAPASRAALNFPTPPQQHAPWQPDASVPTNLTSAVNTLFDQGFPDPRGCDYHQIEVLVSDVWGSKSIVKTTGWLLPNTSSSDTNRYAICWNGLIYPIVNNLGPADLHTDLATNSYVKRGSFQGAAGANQTVLLKSALSTRVLLLLRLGETETALKLWTPDPQDWLMNQNKGKEEDPYRELAGDWAWALFDHVIAAHMRGDESLALATAQVLAVTQTNIEIEAARRGFRRPITYDTPPGGQTNWFYFTFLNQFPLLHADLERREHEGPHISILQTGLDKVTNQSERITALIHDLDLASARQWGQPGGVNIAEDRTVSALIQEGDAAVEPLIDCLEKDDRLTRSVSFGRDFHRDRHVITVKSAAMSALQTILQSGFRDASDVRTYWAKYKNLSLYERFFAILKDDNASARWGEASANIVGSQNLWVYSSSSSRFHQTPGNTTVRLDGESLRDKSNPSVTELMVRRATEIPESNPDGYDLNAACDMVLRLNLWDPPAAPPVAEKMVKRLCDVLKYSDAQNSWPRQRQATYIAKLSMVSARSGNPHAFDDYAAWLTTITPDQMESYLGDALEPLQQFPTNQVLQAAAETMFSDTNSPWSQLPWKRAGLFNPLESDLPAVPAFRHLLARELEKTNSIGWIAYQQANQVSFALTNLSSGGRLTVFPANDCPAIGTKTDLRSCDWIAWNLSNNKYIPFFNPFAPIEKRNAAILSAKELLQKD